MDGSYDGDWSVLEENGALFLPAVGYRKAADFVNVGTHGRYESTTPDGPSYTLHHDFNVVSSSIGPSAQYNYFRYLGSSVRLVRE